MTFPILPASSPTGYNLDKSLRFRASASAFLQRAPAAAGNLQRMTWSFWAKRGSLSGSNGFFLTGISQDGSNYSFIGFNNDNFFVFDRQVGTNSINLQTTQVFRDPSAWYNIVVAIDTTQATAANRVVLYVNGVQITSFSTAAYPAQNYNTFFNRTNQTFVGKGDNAPGTPFFFDGYLAEVNFIDGQALTPTSFGSFNAITGVWQPAPYTGTYGTNGFYLDFETTTSVAALGNDKSGNSNTWTVNNISLTAGVTYDSMTDVCTLTSATAANYAVLNPLDKASTISTAQGNLYATTSTSLTNQQIRASIALPSSGKFYWETKNTGSVNNFSMGLTTLTASLTTEGAGDMFYNEGGVIGNNGSNTSGYATLALNDIVGVAVDVDANKIYWYKNNTLVNSGGTTINITAPFAPMFGLYNSGNAQNVNFGQQPFTYTPPTGFVALNTFNLPTATILKGNTVMDATLYTGNGSTQTITNAAGFQPDLVWVKSRSVARDHRLVDSVRGATKNVRSNTSNVEDTETDGLVSFNSNGFGVGANAGFNESAANLVGWQWRGGGAAVSNTSGSITSSVSANTSAGFSVVTYTGTGANATIGHGLGVAPKMIIVKERSLARSWRVYNVNLASGNVLYLDVVDASTSEPAAFNSTAPTSSVFSVGTGAGTNENANTFVAYCWSEIEGFSKFGSYTGNGSNDGTFVYLGFRPKYVLFKRTSATGDWVVEDTARSAFNQMDARLFPNTADAEISNGNGNIDYLSNGFKLRNSTASMNASGGTFIYMAYAENPFRNSLAR